MAEANGFFIDTLRSLRSVGMTNIAKTHRYAPLGYYYAQIPKSVDRGIDTMEAIIACVSF